MQRIISSSLSPNTEAEDVVEAFRVLLNPSSWQRGSAIHDVEEWFTTYLGVPCAVSFTSGRSALLAILQAFGIGRGDEVLLQAFTCVAVPHGIRESEAMPIYVDIDDRFNIDPKDLEKKVTKRTKAVIVQHTFGIPARMDRILAVAQSAGLMVIEDCAHSLGATYKEKRIGTLGDAAFFSFGRDKVISSVWGGMVTVSAKCKVQSAKLREYQRSLPMPSRGWIAQQLFHPIAFSMILPTYNLVLGKVMLEAAKQMKLLSLPNPPFVSPRRYPNALAQLLLKQLVKLERYNQRRRRVASYYRDARHSGPLDTGAIYLRYPMLVDDSLLVIKKAKQSGILLGNWYHNVIDPKGVDLGAIGYVRGSCPNAEEAASRIINLPTLVTEEEARLVLYAI